MREELDAQLVKDHPILFGDRFGDMRSTAMCWGFECGDGWYDLLKECCDKLEPLCRKFYEQEAAKEKSWYKYVRLPAAWASRLPWQWLGNHLFTLVYRIVNAIQPNVYNNAIYYYGGSPFRASQVKEKFGSLRFYMTASTDEMEDIIREAEHKSRVTCEGCGKRGKIVGGGWLYCRCRECFQRLVDAGYTCGDYDDQEEQA